jgi:hypothetical protein
MQGKLFTRGTIKKTLRSQCIMCFEQIGHRHLGIQRKCCLDFLRDGIGLAACPLDGDDDDNDYTESLLLFIQTTGFHGVVTARVIFISFQKHKNMLCTKVNTCTLVMLLVCFITQRKHVNFNVFFVPIKLYSFYLCDIKLVSLHNAVKFSHLPFLVHFYFSHNKLSRNYV